MINNSNSTKRSTDSKTKKTDNKDDASGSTKNIRKASAIDSSASKATANLTTSTSATKTNDSKTKKTDNKDDASGSTKNKSNSILPLKLDELKKNKKDNEQQLSYYEKQVLKELKGIRKASKNILKTIKKFNS